MFIKVTETTMSRRKETCCYGTDQATIRELKIVYPKVAQIIQEISK